MTEQCEKRILLAAEKLGIRAKREHYLYSDADWPIVYYEAVQTSNGTGYSFSFIGDGFLRYQAAIDRFRKMAGVSVAANKTCVFKVSGASFLVMDTKDYLELMEKQQKEKQQHDEWWERYHAADAETRRLMACGAIQ